MCDLGQNWTSHGKQIERPSKADEDNQRIIIDIRNTIATKNEVAENGYNWDLYKH